jgi:hypothetical protein
VRIVCGVGLNDADYYVTKNEFVAGKKMVVWICPFYRAWRSMLERCYSPAYQSRCATYIGCSVCEEWLTFSNFRRWMIDKNWEGNQLDKDIIVMGNKLYSQECCVFVDQATNKFIMDSGSARGQWPIGVHFHKRDIMFVAQCNNPFTGKREFLGYFTDPATAHQAWRTRKHELALYLADRQIDKRVASALRERFNVQ